MLAAPAPCTLSRDGARSRAARNEAAQHRAGPSDSRGQSQAHAGPQSPPPADSSGMPVLSSAPASLASHLVHRLLRGILNAASHLQGVLRRCVLVGFYSQLLLAAASIALPHCLCCTCGGCSWRAETHAGLGGEHSRRVSASDGGSRGASRRWSHPVSKHAGGQHSSPCAHQGSPQRAFPLLRNPATRQVSPEASPSSSSAHQVLPVPAKVSEQLPSERSIPILCLHSFSSLGRDRVGKKVQSMYRRKHEAPTPAKRATDSGGFKGRAVSKSGTWGTKGHWEAMSNVDGFLKASPPAVVLRMPTDDRSVRSRRRRCCVADVRTPCLRCAPAGLMPLPSSFPAAGVRRSGSLRCAPLHNSGCRREAQHQECVPVRAYPRRAPLPTWGRGKEQCITYTLYASHTVG